MICPRHTSTNNDIPRRKPTPKFAKCLIGFAAIELLITFHTTFTLFDSESNRTTRSGILPGSRALSLQSSGSFDYDKMELSQVIQMHSRSSYQHRAFDPLLDSRTKDGISSARTSSSVTYTTVEDTTRVLQELGINRSNIHAGGLLGELPAWREISNNYGTRPVILGLDRCRAYRETVPAAERILGLAGLFSSGTNVMHHLLLNNCETPIGGQKPQRTFLWQVPWCVDCLELALGLWWMRLENYVFSDSFKYQYSSSIYFYL